MHSIRPLIIFCLIVMATIHAQADTHPARPGPGPSGYYDQGTVEDSIDIHVANGEVVGIRDGISTHRITLGLREEVVWMDARGHVGVVLTDRRLLTLSMRASDWRSRSLRIKENAADVKDNIMISDFLVLAVTPGRAILYDGLVDDWAKKNLPVHDPFEQAVLDNYVAAVITENRVYGVAGRRGRFVAERFLSDETIVSVSQRPHAITLRTNKRLLVFRSQSPFWDAIRLD